jgi:DnaJ-class molecular chaperone
MAYSDAVVWMHCDACGGRGEFIIREKCRDCDGKGYFPLTNTPDIPIVNHGGSGGDASEGSDVGDG